MSNICNQVASQLILSPQFGDIPLNSARHCIESVCQVANFILRIGRVYTLGIISTLHMFNGGRERLQWLRQATCQKQTDQDSNQRNATTSNYNCKIYIAQKISR